MEVEGGRKRSSMKQREQGFDDYEKGMGRDRNPWNPGSDWGQAWLHGWYFGYSQEHSDCHPDDPLRPE